jgi:hypothetical protein
LEAGEFTAEAREAFSNALGRAYAEMDSTIREFTPMARAACVDFVPLFAGSGADERGFIFTLNQDLFLERFLSNRDSRTRAWVDMPGLDSAFWFSTSAPRLESDIEYLFTPHDAQQGTQLRETYWTTPGPQLSYFKLHGSDNWFDSKSGVIRIVGRQKSRVIESYPLLTWYQSIFGEVLRACSNLLVIGYSFRDPHINAPIIAAIEGGLKLYIISPLLPRDFYRSLQSVHGDMPSGNFDPASHKLWNGLAGYYQGTVRDL